MCMCIWVQAFIPHVWFLKSVCPSSFYTFCPCPHHACVLLPTCIRQEEYTNFWTHMKLNPKIKTQSCAYARLFVCRVLYNVLVELFIVVCIITACFGCCVWPFKTNHWHPGRVAVCVNVIVYMSVDTCLYLARACHCMWNVLYWIERLVIRVWSRWWHGDCWLYLFASCS